MFNKEDRKLIFGSVAAKHWFPDFREPKDLDCISRYKPETKESGIEHHWCEPMKYVLLQNKDHDFADPDFLYTIKVSHAAWDIGWDKHMKDIIFLKNKGCRLDPMLYRMLYDYWTEHHGKKKVKLDMSNKEFFTKSVNRKYDHDWLHEFLAFYNKPLHTRIRRNADSPLCSAALWDDLSAEDKIKCALEEIYVVATERYLGKYAETPERIYKIAKIKSIKNLITSMSKGWFNLYLIENIGELYYNDECDNHWLKKLSQLNKMEEKERVYV
jgi:hypothetical protein